MSTRRTKRVPPLTTPTIRPTVSLPDRPSVFLIMMAATEEQMPAHNDLGMNE